MRDTQQIEVEIGDRLFQVTFDRTTSISEESAYDIDGRKASGWIEVDEDYFENLRAVELVDEGGAELVERTVDLDREPALKKKIEDAVDRWMDKNIPQYHC